MESRKLTGFVLNHTSLSASRRLVHTFTQELGLCSGILNLNKKQTAAFLAPLTLVNFQLTGKEHQALHRISEVNIQAHCFQVSSHYSGLILLQHWAGLIQACQPEQQPEARVFRLLGHMLSALTSVPDLQTTFLMNLYFESWLLHLCGVLPRGLSGAAASTDQTLVAWAALDPTITGPIFKVKISVWLQDAIEDWVQDALKLGTLSGTHKVLGNMWAHFLSKELKTRKLLPAQINRK